jgi:hypothetical protein
VTFAVAGLLSGDDTGTLATFGATFLTSGALEQATRQTR